MRQYIVGAGIFFSVITLALGITATFPAGEFRQGIFTIKYDGSTASPLGRINGQIFYWAAWGGRNPGSLEFLSNKVERSGDPCEFEKHTMKDIGIMTIRDPLVETFSGRAVKLNFQRSLFVPEIPVTGEKSRNEVAPLP